MERSEAISKLFAKQPKTLYKLSLDSFFKSIENKFNYNDETKSILDSIGDIFAMIMNIPLPRTILVELFFMIVPKGQVMLNEEGMLFTGQCQDCAKLCYRVLYNDEYVDLEDLFCKVCGGMLFVPNNYY